MIKIVVIVDGSTQTTYYSDINEAKKYLDSLDSQQSQIEEVLE